MSDCAPRGADRQFAAIEKTSAAIAIFGRLINNLPTHNTQHYFPLALLTFFLIHPFKPNFQSFIFLFLSVIELVLLSTFIH